VDNIDRAKYFYNNISQFTDLPLDILSSVYSSNGTVLHGINWLSSPLNENNFNLYYKMNLTFFMQINNALNQPAFGVLIYPEHTGRYNGTWTKLIVQYEPVVTPNKVVQPQDIPPATLRILQSINNYTGFYENGNRYIDLSLNLDMIGPPEEYRTFSGIRASIDNTLLVDRSNSETLPPRKTIITFGWPDLLDVRVGEKVVKTIPINTTDLNAEITLNLVDANKGDGISVNFRPEYVTLPISGVKYVQLEVQAQPNAMNLPPFTNQTVIATYKGFEETPFTQIFNVHILPPLTFTEQITEAIRNSIFTYVMPLIVTAIFLIWLTRRVRINLKNLEEIRVKDILTVDASVIAGVLIFLTVGAAFGTGESVVSFQQVGILTATIVFPFAIAAIRTLILGRVEEYGIKFMIAGFVYLMTSVILIAVIQVPKGEGS
jgi:hypothetical protein